jgi:hypothetical protein
MLPLISPDVLADLRGLSMGACGVAIGLGLVIWLFGWWGHRFWIVLLTTLGAGLAGLAWGKSLGVPPPVAALLLALAAGMLALSLARIAAFVGTGIVAWLAVHHYLPAWDVPLVSFVLGGLAGLILFRFCLMTLTSLVGVLFATYGGLILGEQLGKVDASLWASSNQQLLSIMVGGGTLAGVFAQSLLDRWWWKRLSRDEVEAFIPAPPMPAPVPAPAPPARRRSTLWRLFGSSPARRAA